MTTDPKTFDLAGWLADTDQDDITDRTHETVTVYRHPGLLDAAAGRVAALEPAPQAAVEDEAIGSTTAPAPDALDDARAEFSRLKAEHELTVTCYAVTDDEARAAVDGLDRADPAFAPALFAAACRLPGNTAATPDQWAAIRHAIGPAQWARIDKTLGAVLRHDTGQAVDAVFSSRS